MSLDLKNHTCGNRAFCSPFPSRLFVRPPFELCFDNQEESQRIIFFVSIRPIRPTALFEVPVVALPFGAPPVAPGGGATEAESPGLAPNPEAGGGSGGSCPSVPPLTSRLSAALLASRHREQSSPTRNMPLQPPQQVARQFLQNKMRPCVSSRLSDSMTSGDWRQPHPSVLSGGLRVTGGYPAGANDAAKSG